MKMKSNGQKLCGEKSRHINIRYFFIEDVLKRDTIELIQCPMERMITEYYTKPLQGSLFRKIRNILMGLVPFPDEECVKLDENTTKNIEVYGNFTDTVSRIPVKISMRQKTALCAMRQIDTSAVRQKLAMYTDMVRIGIG